MLTKTSIFCQIMPEKNQFKETYPLKKRKKTPKFVHFKNLYPLLLRLCRLQDVIPKLKKHKLANGPHLRSPQQCLEVSQDSYFRSNKLLLSDQRCERPCRMPNFLEFNESFLCHLSKIKLNFCLVIHTSYTRILSQNDLVLLDKN